MTVSSFTITDRFNTVYRVKVERDTLWAIHLWCRDGVVGHVFCFAQPPVLRINDFVLRDDIPIQESKFARIWRKLKNQPRPVHSVRGLGIGTALLDLICRIASAEGFKRIEGWISRVDTRYNPDLPDWYRRRGFMVLEGQGSLPNQVATLCKELS